GDIGNQGVHQMDIARWGLGLDRLPDAALSLGGRLGYEDDGNTPNSQLTLLEFGDKQLLFEVRGLQTGGWHNDVLRQVPVAQGQEQGYRNTHIGVIFRCEKGYLVIASYSRCLAFDLDGTLRKVFRGGGNHFQGFVDAVRSGDASRLTAGPLEGHLSAALCHLGNVSYRLGHAHALSSIRDPFGSHALANDTFTAFSKHLTRNRIAPTAEVLVGPRLTFDGTREHFTGEHATEANALLTRPYRDAFRVV
ncbi:MAG: gfo/Idh/MocA family oxidoreductase, partial [Planctomycetes bacterium]|nr:gfo/Idh/MocA family oxidoreductase [Planctomycetota bacterium]